MIEFYKELKRRYVFRVAVVYTATAFVVLQVADLVVEPLRLPEWTMTLLIVLMVAGFPVALILAWAFDLTPEGIKRTKPAVADTDQGEGETASPPRRRAVPMVALIIVLAGVSWWAYDFFWSGDASIPENPVVGVAPFANNTNDPQLDWYREGVARLIIDNLAQSRYLQVVTAERMITLADGTTSGGALLDNARQADIDFVLTGEFLSGPDEVTLVARLIDTQNGSQIASTRRDGLGTTELLSASDDIALSVRRKLGVPPEETADSFIADFASSNPKAYETYIQGLRAFVNYDYKEAEEHFSQALDTAPDFTMARYRLAHVTAALGHTSKAKELIDQAIEESDPLPDRDARYIRAAKALIERRNDDAIRIYREIIERYPYETEAHRHLAELYENLNQPDKAVAMAQELERLAPDAPTTWSLLGMSYLSKGDYSNAVQSLQKYVELAPEEANAHHLLGDSYRAQGELDLAVSEYRAALELDPDFHFSTVALATTQVLRGNLDAAARHLSPLASALGVIPRHRIDAGFALAHVRRAQGRFNDAALVLAALEQQLKTEGMREAMGLSVRGTSLMEAGDLESAENLIAQAIERSPGVPTRYLFARGLLELRQNRLDDVRATAREILDNALPPDNPDRTEEKAAAYLRGMALLAEDKAENAIRELSMAVALSGYRYQIYHRGLARAYLRAGDLEQAAAAARDATQSVDLTDPRIDLELERRRARLVLAEAEHALGRVARAAERARSLLELWSDADSGFQDLARARELAEAGSES